MTSPQPGWWAVLCEERGQAQGRGQSRVWEGTVGNKGITVALPWSCGARDGRARRGVLRDQLCSIPT